MNPETSTQENPIEKVIAEELNLKPYQVWAAIRLLDSGATVPFVARYRKEATGGMSDVHLRRLAERLETLRELEKKRRSILETIEKQGRLTQPLREAILAAETPARLDDLYLPFKPKVHNRAQTAKDQGLEPLALKLWKEPASDPNLEAASFVDALKGVNDKTQALTGARDILIEMFSEEPELLTALREKFWAEGWISAAVVPGKETAGEKFRDYFDHKETIRALPSHRALALFRGRKEGALNVVLMTDLDPDASSRAAEYVSAIQNRFQIPSGQKSSPWLLETVRRAWTYKMRIHLELDLMQRLRERAETEAIRVFSENLKALLMAPPAGSRIVLGLDPGFRTGVKAAVVDPTAKCVATTVFYPEMDPASGSALLELVRKHSVELVAIGNGTASRETEKWAADSLRSVESVGIVRVSEAGASVYSASELATRELPELDVSLRGAVSIARRLQDPLAELVKIDPKSIGVGQYQHDVNQTRLGQSLGNAVEDCVNAVGVEINTASASLLSYVSGLSHPVAERIVAHRDAYGAFKNRQEFAKIVGFTPKIFEQSAGFLRIRDGENALDASAVHPEAYPLVERICSAQNKTVKDVIGNASFVRSVNAETFADPEGAFGLPTVLDLLRELEKPGRDPRPRFEKAAFKTNVKEIADLKLGMILEGIVTNVANFGAFIDIGVHQDGLAHISQLSEKYVEDPREIVRPGQVVKVKILSIDRGRNRVGLSLNLKARPSENDG